MNIPNNARPGDNRMSQDGAPMGTAGAFPTPPNTAANGDDARNLPANAGAPGGFPTPFNNTRPMPGYGGKG